MPKKQSQKSRKNTCSICGSADHNAGTCTQGAPMPPRPQQVNMPGKPYKVSRQNTVMHCSICKSADHNKATCPLYCSICKSEGHNKTTCPQLAKDLSSPSQQEGEVTQEEQGNTMIESVTKIENVLHSLFISPTQSFQTNDMVSPPPPKSDSSPPPLALPHIPIAAQPAESSKSSKVEKKIRKLETLLKQVLEGQKLIQEGQRAQDARNQHIQQWLLTTALPAISPSLTIPEFGPIPMVPDVPKPATSSDDSSE